MLRTNAGMGLQEAEHRVVAASQGANRGSGLWHYTSEEEVKVGLQGNLLDSLDQQALLRPHHIGIRYNAKGLM